MASSGRKMPSIPQNRNNCMNHHQQQNEQQFRQQLPSQQQQHQLNHPFVQQPQHQFNVPNMVGPRFIVPNQFDGKQMISNNQQHHQQQQQQQNQKFNQEQTGPDPQSYRLRERRKAIRKPSLERQGGFEQHDEHYAAEQRRKSIMETQQNQQHQHQQQQQQQQQQPNGIQVQFATVQTKPTTANTAMFNNQNHNQINSCNNQAFGTKTTNLNVRTGPDSTQQNSLTNSFTNSAIPDFKMDTSDVFFQPPPQQQQQKTNQMGPFGSEQPQSKSQASTIPSIQQPQTVQQHQKPIQPQEQQSQRPQHPNLQSQDTLSSDIVNLNFDSEQQEEYYLDQQYEENWSRRQAQFENDTNQNQNQHLMNQQSAQPNFGMWNNVQGQQSAGMANGIGGPFPAEGLGSETFFNNKDANQQPQPPSIVISNIEQQNQTAGHNQTIMNNNDIVTSNKVQDNFPVNKETQREESGIFGGIMKQPSMDINGHPVQKFDTNTNDIFATINNQQPTNDSSQINEPKSVTFNEQVDKKSPPQSSGGGLTALFGGENSLVVQTNTEGMSRARVRWINAFNKISSHLNEVNLDTNIIILMV